VGKPRIIHIYRKQIDSILREKQEMVEEKQQLTT